MAKDMGPRAPVARLVVDAVTILIVFAAILRYGPKIRGSQELRPCRVPRPNRRRDRPQRRAVQPAGLGDRISAFCGSKQHGSMPTIRSRSAPERARSSCQPCRSNASSQNNVG